MGACLPGAVRVWLTLGLILVVLLPACRQDLEKQAASVASQVSSSPLAPVTTVPPTTPPVGATLVALPAPEIGSTISVWVYDSKSAAAGGDCAELLPEMVPAPALGRVPARVATCVVDVNTFFRFRLTADAGGVFALERVEILIIGTAEPDQPPRLAAPRCEERLPELIPVSADPGTATYIGVCEIEPLVRGHVHDPAIRVWARVPVDSPVTSFSEDVHCWELAAYLGGPRGVPSFDVPCIIN